MSRWFGYDDVRNATLTRDRRELDPDQPKGFEQPTNDGFIPNEHILADPEDKITESCQWHPRECQAGQLIHHSILLQDFAIKIPNSTEVSVRIFPTDPREYRVHRRIGNDRNARGGQVSNDDEGSEDEETIVSVPG
jgi:hypothetical protein